MEVHINVSDGKPYLLSIADAIAMLGDEAGFQSGDQARITCGDLPLPSGETVTLTGLFFDRGNGHVYTVWLCECLNGEIFYSLKEATIVIEQWRKHFNTIRPHSSLNYRPPRPKHQPHRRIWIGAKQSSSLYPAGPKYPSGHKHHRH